MQFTIIAIDAQDADALQRRFAAREAHIQNTENHKQHMIMGAATLNEKGEMNGSVMIVEFPNRNALDEWLANEPYVAGKVWDKITVLPCKVGPSFEQPYQKP